MEEKKPFEENTGTEAVGKSTKTGMFIVDYHHRIYQSNQKKKKKQFQKEQVKRGYAENYRREIYEKAKETSKRSVHKAAEAVKEFARKHAKAGAGILAVLLLLLYILSSVTSCSLMVGEAVLLSISGSYLSEPEEIEEAELSFMQMEMELENEINDVESEYPDYDEYRYDIGSIGHDPFVLVSYLSAVYQEFTYEDVEEELESLFDAVYALSFEPSAETRTRMETRTRIETHIRYETSIRTETRTGVRVVLDEDGIARPEIYTYEVEVEYEEEIPYEVEIEYEVEVEYEVSILTTILFVTALEDVVESRMTEDERSLYQAYMETKGMLQGFSAPLPGNWQEHISCYYGYRVHPVSGENQLHRGLDIAMPEGTPIYAAHAGTVTTAEYSDSYGYYVVITDEDGYVTKYAHMKELLVSRGMAVEAGIQIGTVGSTGVSTGNHLHLELMHDGEYYNPIFYFN